MIQSPTKYVTQIRKQGGKGGMCVCVCVCFAFQAAKCERPSNAAAFQMTVSVTKGHHLEERVSHEIFSRGKLPFFPPPSLAQRSSYVECQRRRRVNHITLHSIRGRHEPRQPTASIWWHHCDIQNQISSTLCSVMQQQCIWTCWERTGV